MTLIIFGVKLLWGAMKASRQQAGENRARVLRVAARRFREGGIAGVSVADVIHEAGLTHGGFYKQFASKQDLIAKACARSFRKPGGIQATGGKESTERG